LYTGDTTERKNLMEGRCLSGIVAVYYSHVNSIDYPGASCDNVRPADTLEERETLTLLNSLNDFTNRPDSHYWHPGDIDMQQVFYSTTGTSGFDISIDSCVDQLFTGQSGLNSTIEHADTGSRINIDIEATAGSTCYDITPNPEWECSQASALTSWITDYDYKIPAATTLKLVVNLTCTGPNVSLPGYVPGGFFPPPPSDLGVTVQRFNSNGEGVQQNQDFSKLFVPIARYCNDDSPNINIEQLIEFDAPAVEGKTDLAVVQIIGNGGALGNGGNANILVDPPLPVQQEGELGLQINTTTMTGYVDVVPAN
jgi:hypothetical protein